MNKPYFSKLARLICIFVVIALIIFLIPSQTIDPWHIISPKKILTLLTAISFMQVMSIQIAKGMGIKRGSILTGLLSGFISSTATVAALAKASKDSPTNATSQIIVFIASTISMMIVSLFIIFLGTEGIHYNLLFIIAGPVCGALVMLIGESRTMEDKEPSLQNLKFEFMHTLKLMALIMFTITAAKVSEIYFKGNGTSLLTFIVSLFEMHGSIIVNLQLHDAGMLSVKQLGSLIAISIISSYTSKLFFVLFLGSQQLKIKVIKYTAVSFVMLAIGWFGFLNSIKSS